MAGGASDAQLCYPTLHGNSPPTIAEQRLLPLQLSRSRADDRAFSDNRLVYKQ
jgi:hypothetical protein